MIVPCLKLFWPLHRIENLQDKPKSGGAYSTIFGLRRMRLVHGDAHGAITVAWTVAVDLLPGVVASASKPAQCARNYHRDSLHV
jgi:hypothetical protein